MSNVKLQIKAVVKDPSYAIILHDCHHWVKATVSDSVADMIQKCQLDVNDVASILKSEGRSHNLPIVSKIY